MRAPRTRVRSRTQTGASPHMPHGYTPTVVRRHRALCAMFSVRWGRA